jgi:hypothetical protein
MRLVARGLAMEKTRKVNGSAQFASICHPSHADAAMTSASRLNAALGRIGASMLTLPSA